MITSFFGRVILLMVSGFKTKNRLLVILIILLLRLCVFTNYCFYGLALMGWLWGIVYVGGIIVVFTYSLFFAGEEFGEVDERWGEHSSILHARFLIFAVWFAYKGNKWGELLYRVLKNRRLAPMGNVEVNIFLERGLAPIYIIIVFILLILVFSLHLLKEKRITRGTGLVR